MEQKKRLLTAGLLIVLGVALFAAGLAFLPDTLVMQITASGAAGNTMPKALGLALPLALTAVFAVLWYRTSQSKHLLCAVVGLALFAPTFFMNLTF